MPPRKSGASTVSATEANGDVSTLSTATHATASSSTQHAHPRSSRQSGGKQDDGVSIDDLLLPRSLVSRLSRGVLPPNTSLQKDALLALTRSATVFISYLAHHANEQSQLRHKKTLGVQDVMAALKEIEFAHVMDLGAVGKDGRTGGRLERQVEVYEEIIGKKRRGYREKVKARESGGGAADGDGDAEDRGEPSNKKIRRTSAEEEDEEERMLEQQLNGTVSDEVAPAAAEKAKAKRKSRDSQSISVVVRNGKGKGKPDSITREDGGHGNQAGDEDVEEADDDEHEEDEEGDDEDEDDDQDDEDEDEEQDDEDDDETGAQHGDGDDDDDIEIDDSRPANGRLLPDGNVEIGSDDESD
ncbi:DNA polymerase epsilon subunit 3 [Fonsecaea pedrosoi]|nr:DNA polymerase epsilon subunit 3 [Fonsecaea pedrosoi]